MLRAADHQPDGAPDGADRLAHAETDIRPYGRAHAGAHARTDDQPDAGTDADAHAAPYSSAYPAPHGPPDGQAHDRAYVDADGQAHGRGRALALRARRRVQDGRRKRVPHLRRDARRRRRRRMPHAVGRRPLLIIVRDGSPQNRRDDLGARVFGRFDQARLWVTAPRHGRLGRLLPLPAPRRLPLHRQHRKGRQGGFDDLGRGPARGRQPVDGRASYGLHTRARDVVLGFRLGDRQPYQLRDFRGDWFAGQRRGLRRYLWRRLLRHLELQRRLGPTLVGRPAHQRRAAARRPPPPRLALARSLFLPFPSLPPASPLPEDRSLLWITT